MNLIDFALDYAIKSGASPGYTEQLRVLTKRLPWQVSDLTVSRIDSYLTQALHILAPTTVANHRRMLNTLRKAAIRKGLVVDECTDALRRVKCAHPLPRAWTHDEIRRLIEEAKKMQRGTRHCRWDVLLPAYILVAYSSGLRLGDMLSVRHDSIRGNKLAMIMAKTRRPHVVMLDEAAFMAIASLPVQGPRIFGDLVGRCVFIRAFRRLVKRAGLHGSGKYLRRSSATYAVIAGQDPTGHLGHATAGLAMKHYVDPVLVAESKSPVPSIPAALRPGFAADQGPAAAFSFPGHAWQPRSG
jgi:integrase